MELKRCIKCGDYKDPQNFSPSKQRKDGRYPYCHPCEAGRKAKFRDDNPGINIEKAHISKYGHGRAERAAILASQDNRCGRCSTSFATGDTICGDHNHFCCDSPYTCGKCFNAYVCCGCNTLLRKDWILANPHDAYVQKYY